MVYRSHTSVLLKHMLSKLGRLSAFVIIAASGCLFYHYCGFPRDVSRDHLQVVNIRVDFVLRGFDTHVLPKVFPHLEQENGFTRVSCRYQLQLDTGFTTGALTRSVVPAKTIHPSVRLVTNIADVRTALLGFTGTRWTLQFFLYRSVTSQNTRHVQE